MDRISCVFPFYNREVVPFKFCAESISRQSKDVYETIVIDYASDSPYGEDMVEVCDEYSFKYIRLPIDGFTPNAKAVFLWNTGANHGIRSCVGDFIFYGGIDRIFHANVMEDLINLYNLNKDKYESMINGKGVNINTPPKEIYKTYNFDELIASGKWRGGYAFHFFTKKWIGKVQGLDETIKWYGDIDLARRAVLDGVRVNWTKLLTLHMADHKASHRVYGGPACGEIKRRGKLWISKDNSVSNNNIVRNDKDWGLLTEKKLKWALSLETQT